EGYHVRVPHCRALVAREAHAEELAGDGEDAGFDLLVGEEGADGLRVEVVIGATILLFPEARVAEREWEGFGVAAAHEGFELAELALYGFACGLLDFIEEFAHVGGGAHHLVDGGEVGPAAEAEGFG